MPTADEVATEVVNQPYNGRGDKVKDALQTAKDALEELRPVVLKMAADLAEIKARLDAPTT